MNYLDLLEIKNSNKLDGMNMIKTQLIVLFMSLAEHQFEWKGLPEEIPSWCLERVLNFYGQGVFFKHEEYNQYLITSFANTSMLNIYGEPTSGNAIAINGYNFGIKNVSSRIGSNGELLEQNAVLIKNNDLSCSSYFMIKPIIDRLIFIWESLGINEGLSRIKAIIHANKNVGSALKGEMKKIIGDGSAVAVINEKNNILDSIEKVDLNVEYKPDAYWQDFDKTFALACQFVGITTNMASQKKERLLTGEIESNDELTTIVEDTRLTFRKLACEEINKLYGLNVSVDNKVSESKMTKPEDNTPQQKSTLDD